MLFSFWMLGLPFLAEDQIFLNFFFQRTFPLISSWWRAERKKQLAGRLPLFAPSSNVSTTFSNTWGIATSCTTFPGSGKEAGWARDVAFHLMLNQHCWYCGNSSCHNIRTLHLVGRFLFAQKLWTIFCKLFCKLVKAKYGNFDQFLLFGQPYHSLGVIRPL